MENNMPGRILPLINNEVYHVFNRGSDKRDIFLKSKDYKRFTKTFYYYQHIGPKPKFSMLSKETFNNFHPTPNSKLVEIFSYCLMPNHFHFLVRQLKTNGVSIFMSQVLNSYTKYFNIKRKRIGPLFQGAFKTTRVESDEQLIHLSRYIHLNPVVSGIVNSPNNYTWSSYKEYADNAREFCSTDLILELFPSRKEYCKFIEEQIEYGITLEIIKHQLINDE
jgi:putative transposase